MLGRRGPGRLSACPIFRCVISAAATSTALAYREVGHGRPVVLIHGYFSNATVNWVNYPHAAAVAARGFRVIMPDLRGHGDSARPQQAAAYPPDILADDGFALIEHLGLASYALGGYSLGGRTTIRMLARGAAPSRAVVAGMGLDGVLHAPPATPISAASSPSSARSSGAHRKEKQRRS